MEFLFQIPIVLGKALWEPVGILFWCGILWLIWNYRNHWRDPFFAVAFACLIFAFGWRFLLKISTARYYLTFLLPALFIIFYLIREGPCPKKYSCWLLLILYALCLGKDLRHNEMDKENGQLYQILKEDAKKYRNPLMILSGGSISKAAFYAQLPSMKIGHSDLNRELYFDSLKHNLGFYHSIVDCIYFCLEFRNNERKLYRRWQSSPEFTELSVNPDKEAYKKQKAVFKYIPMYIPADYEVSPLNILRNGDFAELMSTEGLETLKNNWKDQLPYMMKNGFAFPRGWSVYHSQTRRSDAIAQCLKEENKNIIDLFAEKNSISFITPFFPSDKAFILCFSIRALRDSRMDLIVHLQNPKGKGSEFYPYFPVFLPAGAQKDAKIIFPAFPGRLNGRIHFWMTGGHVRLSNVSIHPLIMNESYQYE